MSVTKCLSHNKSVPFLLIISLDFGVSCQIFYYVFRIFRKFCFIYQKNSLFAYQNIIYSLQFHFVTSNYTKDYANIRKFFYEKSNKKLILSTIELNVNDFAKLV